MSELLKSIIPMTIYAIQDAEKEEHSSTAGGVLTCTATVEISMETPQENGNEPNTIYNNSTLRRIPKEAHTSNNDICSMMFMAALFVVARNWKQPRCPSTEEWIEKMWYIYTMEYYSAEKKQWNL